jgi:hypothetical protein
LISNLQPTQFYRSFEDPETGALCSIGHNTTGRTSKLEITVSKKQRKQTREKKNEKTKQERQKREKKRRIFFRNALDGTVSKITRICVTQLMEALSVMNDLPLV